MSKYVIETGPGYCSVSAVSTGPSLSFGIATVPVDWDENTIVRAWPEGETVALDALKEPRDDEISSFHPYHSGGNGLKLNVSQRTVEHLDARKGDDVRLYRREAGGLCLVRADSDPFLDD